MARERDRAATKIQGILTTHDMRIASEATETAVVEIERWRGRFNICEKALVEIEHHSNDKNAAATARAALTRVTID